jgi:hypothetical protein
VSTARDCAGTVAAFVGHEDAPDELLDFLLWEYTAYPFSDWQTTVDQLVEVLGAPEGEEGKAE